MTPDEKRLLDILRIMEYDSKGTKGWLVRFNYYPSKERGAMRCHSKLFSWSKYASPDAALEAARKYRDEWAEKHKDELWIRGGGEYSQALPRNNSSGILGVRRTTRTLKSGATHNEWQATVNLADGRIVNTKFSVKRWGEVGAMRKAIEFRRDNIKKLLEAERFQNDPGIPQLLDYYDDILANLQELSAQDTGRPLLEIAMDEKLDATSKYEEISIRIGQQRFRRLVLDFFEGRCAVTGCRTLVRASHIKPWRYSSDSERLDWRNGLALSPAYDAAFDVGLVSFTPDGRIMVNRGFAGELRMMGISESASLSRVSEGHMVYLDWHRKNVFDLKKGANKAPEPTPGAVTPRATEGTSK